MFDAVGKLNEVKGMRGLCRYFKEVAQSARPGGQVNKNRKLIQPYIINLNKSVKYKHFLFAG